MLHQTNQTCQEPRGPRSCALQHAQRSLAYEQCHQLIIDNNLHFTTFQTFLRRKRKATFKKKRTCESEAFALTQTRMGAFGVILLVLFICFLLYFFGGMIVLKLRGASGLEIIPNHIFWLSLPLKIKVVSTELEHAYKITSFYPGCLHVPHKWLQNPGGGLRGDMTWC